MEDLCYRYPVLGKLVFNNLDDQSLYNCQEASRVSSQFVIRERFFWIRVIQKYHKNLSEFKNSWDMIIHRTSADTLKQLAIAVHHFFKRRIRAAKRRNIPLVPIILKDWSPFHIAAESGLMQLCAHVYHKTDDHQLTNKNPANKRNGVTGLHVAAQKGHKEIYQFIMDKVENKNPAAVNGVTPLHLAAQKG
jgi:hypothetical protein